MLKNGIKSSFKLDPERLHLLVKEQNSFAKRLIAYLKELENSLSTLTDDISLKPKICQILSELGCLVYPNTGACYSLIPKTVIQNTFVKKPTNQSWVY